MKKAIICVDDEKIIIKSLEEQLYERFGDKYIYEMAMSGEEALEIIDELVDDSVRVILLISDWLMQGMKGDELLVEIHKRYPGILKIMLTGQATPEAVNNAWENGGLSAYVTKPWDKEKLMDKISSFLEDME